VTDIPSSEDSTRFNPTGTSGELKRRSAHGAVLTLAVQLFKMVIQFCTQVALARMLAPADFGLVAMVVPLIAAIQLLNDLGLSAAVVQRQTISHGQLSALFWVNAAAGTLLALLAVALGPWVADFYDQPQLVWIIAAMGSILALSGLTTQQMALMTRSMRFGTLATIDLASVIVSMAAGIIAAMAGLGFWALVLMQVANGLTMLVLSWALSGWIPSRPRFQRDLGSLLAFGGNVTAYNILGYLINNLHSVLIGAKLGPAALGLYDRSYRLVFQPLWQTTTPILRVAVPLLSRLTDREEEYRHTYLMLLAVTMVATVPGLTATVALAHPLITSLLGARWAEAAPVFAWLSIAALTLQLRQAATWLYQSQDRTREQLRWGGAGSIAIILSYPIGLYWGGLVGVAMGAALSGLFIQNPLLWWNATRHGPIRLRDFLSLAGMILISATISALALRWLQTELGWAALWQMILLVAAGYAIFFVLIALTPRGRRLIGDLFDIARKLMPRR